MQQVVAARGRMGGVYVPRTPTTGVLYGLVRAHLGKFVAAIEARTDGIGLPSFVRAEFQKFLRCGVLAHGFARVRCGDCLTILSATFPGPSRESTRVVGTRILGCRLVSRGDDLVEAFDQPVELFWCQTAESPTQASRRERSYLTDLRPRPRLGLQRL